MFRKNKKNKDFVLRSITENKLDDPTPPSSTLSNLEDRGNKIISYSYKNTQNHMKAVALNKMFLLGKKKSIHTQIM